jgi:imidazolonepropionase-like amidohydrolase
MPWRTHILTDSAERACAATRLGGQLMMQGDALGQIKPGYLADLLLVDGNPAQDVGILRDRTRLRAIMKDGVFHKAPAPRAAAAPAVAAE